jgi:hypothetical protein
MVDSGIGDFGHGRREGPRPDLVDNPAKLYQFG